MLTFVLMCSHCAHGKSSSLLSEDDVRADAFRVRARALGAIKVNLIPSSRERAFLAAVTGKGSSQNTRRVFYVGGKTSILKTKLLLAETFFRSTYLINSVYISTIIIMQHCVWCFQALCFNYISLLLLLRLQQF